MLVATSLLIRHGRAWRNDAVYRWLWLLVPVMLTSLFTIWMFQDPVMPVAGGNNGIWWSTIDGGSFKLAALASQAVSDPSAAAELRAHATAGDPLAEFYMGYSLDPDTDPKQATVA